MHSFKLSTFHSSVGPVADAPEVCGFQLVTLYAATSEVGRDAVVDSTVCE
jgi:hypothetical protein